MLSTPLGRFRVIALIEGVSYLVLLLIAMPIKYAAGDPRPVWYVGLTHGVLFTLYCLAGIHVWVDRKWSLGRVGYFVLMSIVPGGTFYADGDLRRELAQQAAEAKGA